MKKLLFTAVAFITFTGLQASNNESEILANNEKLELILEENTKTNKLEEKDVWFCYLSSVSSSYNFMNGVTTITATYSCTWYSLAVQ